LPSAPTDALGPNDDDDDDDGRVPPAALDDAATEPEFDAAGGN
jgi:hypothetical protein